MRKLSMAERFWSKVEKSEGCWLWLAYRTPKGYGRFCGQLAHRVALGLSGVTIPPGLFACHHCDTPACVRPAHLFLGTNEDNMADAVRKGRVVRLGLVCGHGHPFTAENTRMEGNVRICRRCVADRVALHRARKRGEVRKAA